MTRVYVGNLPIDVKEREIEDFFYKYGRITNVSVKIPNRPPAFAFITFDDDRDAEDAVRGRDGVEFLGGKIRVEIAKSSGGGGGGGRGRDDFGRGRGYEGGGRERGGSRESRPYTDSRLAIVVTGLPRSASWQDLKDFGRSAGDVRRSNIYGGGEGVLEYALESDVDTAVRTLDDTEFKNRYDRAYVRVKRAASDRKRSYSRSRSRSRSPRDRGSRRDRSRSRGSDRSDEKRPSKGVKNDDDDRRSP